MVLLAPPPPPPPGAKSTDKANPYKVLTASSHLEKQPLPMCSARTNVSLLLPRLFLLLPLPPGLFHPSETIQVSGHMESQIRFSPLQTRYLL